MSYKLDIFKLLKHIDNGDYDFVDTLSDDELKAFTPYVVQTWLYGSYDNKELRTVLLNELCNSLTFSLQKHPKLLYKLFCNASGFGETNHYFPKAISKTKKPLTVKLLKSHYVIGDNEANDMLSLYDSDGIKELITYNGVQDEEAKKVLKEWQ